MIWLESNPMSFFAQCIFSDTFTEHYWIGHPTEELSSTKAPSLGSFQFSHAQSLFHNRLTAHSSPFNTEKAFFIHQMLWLQSSWPLIQMISWLLNRCKDHFHISLIFIHNNKKCMFLCITVRVQRCMKTLQFAQLSDQIVSVYSMRPWWMVLVSCLEVDCTWLGMEAASLNCRC